MDMRDALFETLLLEMVTRDDIVILTADTDAHGLQQIQEKFPQAVINVGVSEQAAILVATGLAMAGKKVILYSFIPFITLRCFELIKVNLYAHNLPVVIVGAGAGLSFSQDGPTHHAVTDIAVMRTLAGTMIFNPSDSATARASMLRGLESKKGITYIRLDKGDYESVTDEALNPIRVRVHGETADIAIITTGVLVHTALAAVKTFQTDHQVDVSVFEFINVADLSPLDLLDLRKYRVILLLEENTEGGGALGTGASFIKSLYPKATVVHICIPDDYALSPVTGTREFLYRTYHLSVSDVVQFLTTI